MYTPLATTFTAVFCLRFCFKIISFFSNSFFLLEVSRELPQRSTFEHITRCSYFLVVHCAVFNPSTHFCFGYFNPVCSDIFGCVTFQPTFSFCSVPNLPHLHQFVHLFPYNGFQFLFFLGRVPIKPLDFANFFRTCKHDS